MLSQFFWRIAGRFLKMDLPYILLYLLLTPLLHCKYINKFIENCLPPPLLFGLMEIPPSVSHTSIFTRKCYWLLTYSSLFCDGPPWQCSCMCSMAAGHLVIKQYQAVLDACARFLSVHSFMRSGTCIVCGLVLVICCMLSIV